MYVYSRCGAGSYIRCGGSIPGSPFTPNERKWVPAGGTQTPPPPFPSLHTEAGGKAAEDDGGEEQQEEGEGQPGGEGGEDHDMVTGRSGPAWCLVPPILWARATLGSGRLPPHHILILPPLSARLPLALLLLPLAAVILGRLAATALLALLLLLLLLLLMPWGRLACLLLLLLALGLGKLGFKFLGE